MVSIGYIAMVSMRHDTVFARAVRRALGITARPRPERRRERVPEPEPERFDPDLMYCFGNEHPVMDGVRK